MSKKKRVISELLEGWADYSNKGGEDVDILLIFDEFSPEGIVPKSDRAKTLFQYWGWDGTSTGIIPPDNAEDFFVSAPKDYKAQVIQILEGLQIYQHITLPQEIPVLH